MLKGAALLFGMATSTGPYVAVVGSGWTARLAALALQARQVPTLLLEPFVDPDGLPRPFPPSSNTAWLEFCRDIGIHGQWRDFGGAVVAPFSQRKVTDTQHRQSLRYAGGLAVCEANDTVWAWSEPQAGYLALFQELEHLLRQTGVVRQPLVQLKIKGGILRRARLANLANLRDYWLAVLPSSDWRIWRSISTSAVIPLQAHEGQLSWWFNLERDYGYVCGPLEPWPFKHRPKYLGEATTQSSYFWGLTSCRGLEVLRVPSPAQQPANEWFAHLQASLNRLFIRHAAK